MDFWEIVTIGVIGALIHKGRRDAEERAEEERRRVSTPCSFSDGISSEQFEEIVRKSGRHIKRLTQLTVSGSTVYGTVRAQSGLSEWDFKVDFNDYGHLTGRYWLSSDNDDSNIPGHVAENISTMIHEFPKGFENSYSNTNSRTTQYTNAEAEYDDTEDEQNLEQARQQAAIFKQRKKERAKKKVKHFFIGLFIAAVAALALFIAYEVWQYKKGIEVSISSSELIGEKYKSVVGELEDAGFTHVYAYPEYDLDLTDIGQENTVISVVIDEDSEFSSEDKYPYDTKVEIKYHALKNVYVPIAAKDAEGMNYEELVTLLKDAGFSKIKTSADFDLITGWIHGEYSVESITINGESDFEENTSYRPDTSVEIVYHRFKKDKE